MKVDNSLTSGFFGEIKVVPESLDDLWHLSYLIRVGDLVYATTMRSVEGASDKLRPEKLEKRQVRLGIRVQKVELHRYSERLRVTGIIESGIDTGSFHTLNVETGFEISIVKHWHFTDLDRIERAIKASLNELVHIVTIEEGESEIYRMRQYGPEIVTSIVAGSGKGAPVEKRSTFFEDIINIIRDINGPLVVAGPGFVKEELVKKIRTETPSLFARVVVVDTRRTGAGAIQEIIGKGVFERLLGDMQLKREVNFMDEFLKRIADGGRVAYGWEEVSRAVSIGAVETLLVAGDCIHSEKMRKCMDDAEKNRAAVIVFSMDFEPGSRLMGLGGVAALLRYSISG